MLTARNLKSRLTVYQRTHSEKSAPKKPTQEKIATNVTMPANKQCEVRLSGKISVSVKKQISQTNLHGDEIVEWSDEMSQDMLDTLEMARVELKELHTGAVNERWLQLWKEKHPSCDIDTDQLNNHYKAHIKKTCDVSITQKIKSEIKEEPYFSASDSKTIKNHFRSQLQRKYFEDLLGEGSVKNLLQVRN